MKKISNLTPKEEYLLYGELSSQTIDGLLASHMQLIEIKDKVCDFMDKMYQSTQGIQDEVKVHPTEQSVMRLIEQHQFVINDFSNQFDVYM